MKLDAQRIAEMEMWSHDFDADEQDSFRQLRQYALAAMEAEGHMLNLIIDADALWGGIVSQPSKQAKAALARLRAAREAE